MVVKFRFRLFKWPILSWQMVIIFISISCFLTSAATMIAFYLPGTVWNSPIPLPIFIVYIVNFPFDFITLFVTLHVLRIVQKGHFFQSIAAIIGDIAIAMILAFVCFAFVGWSSAVAQKYSWPGSYYPNKNQQEYFRKRLETTIKNDGFSDDASIKINSNIDLTNYLSRLPRAWVAVLKDRPYKWDEYIEIEVREGVKFEKYKIENDYPKGEYWITAAISATTLIPTCIYMAFLLILILSKALLYFVRRVFLHLLEILTLHDPEKTPKDFMPGTLIGILFGVIAAFVKSIAEIIKIYAT